MTSHITDTLLAWVREQRLTIDDTRQVKEKALDILHSAYPFYEAPFCLDVQYYTGGEYNLIPRDLATGIALCGELPRCARLEDTRTFEGRSGRYEYTGTDFIFRRYLVPTRVSVEVSIRESC